MKEFSNLSLTKFVPASFSAQTSNVQKSCAGTGGIMWLISGGAFQGKLEYALALTGRNKKEVADGMECSMQELFEKPLANHFHSWIDRMLKEEQDVNTLVEPIIDHNPGIVIIVNELGCGIVPMDPYDRMYREFTGRICCRLAKEAEEVHRVICGLGTVIKNA